MTTSPLPTIAEYAEAEYARIRALGETDEGNLAECVMANVDYAIEAGLVQA